MGVGEGGGLGEVGEVWFGGWGGGVGVGGGLGEVGEVWLGEEGGQRMVRRRQRLACPAPPPRRPAARSAARSVAGDGSRSVREEGPFVRGSVARSHKAPCGRARGARGGGPRSRRSSLFHPGAFLRGGVRLPV